MKNLPTALKAVLNLFFFVIYSVVGMIIGGYLYGYILDKKGMNIPAADDPVNMKIGVGILLLVFILTVIFRKHFYLQVCEGKKTETIQKKATSYTAMKKAKQEKKQDQKQEKKGNDDIEILLDKEIK